MSAEMIITAVARRAAPGKSGEGSGGEVAALAAMVAQLEVASGEFASDDHGEQPDKVSVKGIRERETTVARSGTRNGDWELVYLQYS